MAPISRLEGLVAAVHTPFHANFELNLAVVETQAAFLLRQGVKAVFVGGTTGECASLSHTERLRLAERWVEVARGSALRVIVHVGGNNLAEACAQAKVAARQGAWAIAALAPCYFKPRTIDDLVTWCEAIAASAPELPFYFYDIPSLTGVAFAMPEFLGRAAPRIPSLTGLKFTNPDLVAYQECLRADGGRWDLPFGVDEQFLAALALGARGAVGSGYNFAAPIYLRLLAAFARGDLDAAREEQWRGVQLVRALAAEGYLAASKWLMAELDVPVGPVRLPLRNLDASRVQPLREALDRLCFRQWLA